MGTKFMLRDDAICELIIAACSVLLDCVDSCSYVCGQGTKQKATTFSVNCNIRLIFFLFNSDYMNGQGNNRIHF